MIPRQAIPGFCIVVLILVLLAGCQTSQDRYWSDLARIVRDKSQ
jgi:uncharacterized protein YcfL